MAELVMIIVALLGIWACIWLMCRQEHPISRAELREYDARIENMRRRLAESEIECEAIRREVLDYLQQNTKGATP